MSQLFVSSHVGLGDQVYMLPFIRQLALRHKVFVATAWPEIYQLDDSHIALVPVDRNLRTQKDNLRRVGNTVNWSKQPTGPEARVVPLSYAIGLIREKRSVYEALLEQTAKIEPCGLDDLDFTLSLPKPDSTAMFAKLLKSRKPLALFRPPTRRKEWDCPARNPAREIWEPLLTRLRKTHHVHWVGFLETGAEELDGLQQSDVRGQDTLSMHGELSWTEMAFLMWAADVCVCPPCNWIPLGLAIGARVFCVFGGHVPPSALVCPQMIRYEGQWTAVAPEPFCFCVDNRHSCNKTLDRMKALRALERVLTSSRKLPSFARRA
jgi:hypothetical protein